MERDTSKEARRIELRLERGVKRLLTCTAALLVVIAAELWMLMPGPSPTAFAQIPDTALQRQNIVAECQRTNELLKSILGHLQSKSIKVVVQGAEKSASGNSSRSGR
jgi:hypothetical protein